MYKVLIHLRSGVTVPTWCDEPKQRYEESFVEYITRLADFGITHNMGMVCLAHDEVAAIEIAGYEEDAHVT